MAGVDPDRWAIRIDRRARAEDAVARMHPPDRPFVYVPACSSPRCRRPATAKIAALWTFAAGREYKNYGLACPDHAEALLARARDHRGTFALAENESVGDVVLLPISSSRPLPHATPTGSSPLAGPSTTGKEPDHDTTSTPTPTRPHRPRLDRDPGRLDG